MFRQIDLARENDLEHLLINEPDALDQGLKIISHQRRANSKFLDILAVDSKGVLTVIELKLDQDDGMLVQALEYYDYVVANRDRFQSECNKAVKIDIQEEPRIILIASSFSERIKKAAHHVTPELNLMEYSYLESKSAERGLIFKEVLFDSDPSYTAPVQLEGAFIYISDPKVRALCQKIHQEIAQYLPDMEVVPRTQRIDYKYKNRSIGGLSLRKEMFYPWWWPVPKRQRWDEAKIQNRTDWTKYKTRVLKGLEARFRALGGK